MSSIWDFKRRKIFFMNADIMKMQPICIHLYFQAGSKAKVEVTQKERKPAFIAELQPTKVIEGFPVKLEVKILGHPQPKIKW